MNRQGKLELFGVVAFISGIISLIVYAVLTVKKGSDELRFATGGFSIISFLTVLENKLKLFKMLIRIFDKLFEKKKGNSDSVKIEQKVDVKNVNVKDSEVQIHQNIQR